MNKYLVIALVAMNIMACHTAQKRADVVMPTTSETVPPKVTNGVIDPVCEMAKDSSWTDCMVYGNDSVWFCSEACKKVFLARPAKYEKNLRNNRKS